MKTLLHLKLSLILVILPAFAFANNEKCSLADGINILTENRMLYLCERGNAVKEFKISLGRKGVGKKQSHDNKTSLGLYELASPRKSERFGVFIPIVYPTKEQLVAGYSGNSVGIHGPVKWLNWLGALNTVVDWTKGCVAVGSDEQINFIGDWVRRHPGEKVLIK